MKATLLLKEKKIWSDGTIVERVVWALPDPSDERPHALKYRLYCGRGSTCVVRYDNEAGKGDQRHYGERDEPYQFMSLTQLLHDFETDVQRLTGGVS